MNIDKRDEQIACELFHIPKTLKRVIRLHASHISIFSFIKNKNGAKITVPLNHPKGYIRIDLDVQSLKLLRSKIDDILEGYNEKR